MKLNNRYLVGIISLAIFIAIVYYFSTIVTYVLIAWVFSLIGAPFMSFYLEKLRFNRLKVGYSLASIATILTLISLFTVVGILIGPLVYQQALNLANVDYQMIAEAMAEPLNQFDDWLVKIGLSNEQYSNSERLRFLLDDWFKPGEISNFFSNMVQIAGEILIGIFSVLFMTFFFLKEQGLFLGFVTAMVPSRYEKQTVDLIKNSIHLLRRYFAGILTQVLIITVVASLLLTVFGVKNAILIAAFAAVINVIPYLGPIIGAGFGVAITVSANLDADFYLTTFPMILKVLATFAMIQLLDNFVLQPFIFSTSVLAHPLEIFIIILIGSQLGGIVGMIVAIPTYTILRVFGAFFLSEFKIVQRLTQRLKESGELES